jgi:hypothetical protein
MVLPDQIAVRDVTTAFNDRDSLRDKANASRPRSVLGRLVEAANRFA